VCVCEVKQKNPLRCWHWKHLFILSSCRGSSLIPARRRWLQ